MKYDLEIDGPREDARLFDADMKEIEDVIRFDTETGEVTQLARDGNNYLLNAARDAVIRRTSTFKAPLQFVPHLIHGS